MHHLDTVSALTLDSVAVSNAAVTPATGREAEWDTLQNENGVGGGKLEREG